MLARCPELDRAALVAADEPAARCRGADRRLRRRALASRTSTWRPPRGLIAIVGPNGAGKSTLLKAVLGLVPRRLRHSRGLRPAARRQARDRLAYVPQRAAVDWDFPATALDVVLDGPVRRDRLAAAAARPPPSRRARAASTGSAWPTSPTARSASSPAASSSASSSPAALAQDADILLLDEPFAGVDAATGRRSSSTCSTSSGRRAGRRLRPSRPRDRRRPISTMCCC